MLGEGVDNLRSIGGDAEIPSSIIQYKIQLNLLIQGCDMTARFPVLNTGKKDLNICQFLLQVSRILNQFWGYWRRSTGVGAGKANKYGKPFLELIAQYVEENDIMRPNDMVVKSVVNKSGLKVFIITNIDRKISLDDLAEAKNLSLGELLLELERIVASGTKIDINYYIQERIDEYHQEEIMDYFSEAESDSIEEALETAKAEETKANNEKEEIFIIGGGTIYKLMLPYAEKLYLTIVDDEPERVDTYFPDYSEFKNLLSEEHHEYNGLKYKFIELTK